jgi:drug/metabolite transporter (DMT)-like permease
MSNRAKGILSIVASAFGFALMALFVRLCDDFGGEVSSFQKSFFRNAIALVIAAVVFARSRRSGTEGLRLPSGVHSWSVLTMRSVFGLVGIFANFYALSKIPIGEAMTLNKTAPFFTVFFSWLLLGEKATRRQIACLFLAFAGALLVMKPGFRASDAFAAACALIGGLGAGLAYVCVHELGREKVNSAFIVLFFSAFSCVGSLPFMVFGYSPMTAAQILILLGAGAGAALGQFGVTVAYRYAEPRSIALYDYTNVLFTALLGFVFFGQTPDVVSVAGFAIILLAAFRMTRTTSPGQTNA